MKSSFFQFILFVGVVMLSSCGETSEQNNASNTSSSQKVFSLLSSKATGIDFVNQLEDNPLTDDNVLSFPHYYNGAGVAIADFNNDGLKDVFLSGNEVDNKLYLNKGDLKFEDISAKAGINVNKKWSTGASVVDINADGFMDIYVCQYGLKSPENDRKNTLYINNGDLTFTEKAAEYGLDDSNESMQAAFLDYDKDGDLDCFVMNESKYVRVVHQKVFEDLKIKKNLEAASSNLFRNDGGKFTKVTEQAGMLRWGFGLGLCVSDINEDGWPDIYVANDYSVPDFMYINNGDGTFTDEVKQRTKQISFFGMGCDVADINNDGHVDIGVVDMATSDHFRGKTLMESMNTPIFWYYINKLGYPYQYMFNSLNLNNGSGKFNNIAHMAGVGSTDWSWAANFADFDNNGWKDYFISNGFRRYSRDNDFMISMAEARKKNGGNIPMNMRKEMYAKMPEVKLPNLFFKNTGSLVFEEVGEQIGLENPSYSNGAAYGDLDNDGDLELIVSNIDHEVFVYKNNSVENASGGWLQVDLKGNDNATILVGAKVILEAGEQKLMQEWNPIRGYLGCVDPMLHFGVGSIKTIDKITVIWPDGREQVSTQIAANQRVVIKKETSGTQYDFANSDAQKIFESITPTAIGVDFTHKENNFDDFATQILLPHRQSTTGPKIRTGDLDGDGLEDFFICGPSGQSSQLYFQKSDGNFELAQNQPWATEAACEDTDVLFLDADNNGTMDIYVVSGGYEMKPESENLRDRLYINFGKRNFKRVNVPLPVSNGFVIKSADYDQDGDMDIFIGGGTEHGRYPFSERSYLLRNEGKGFTDVTKDVAPDLVNPGLIKDAHWTDLNGDKFPELVVVGEWTPISIFQNDNGTLSNASEKYGTSNLKGWWYSISEGDFNKDGHKDLIVGNVGLNNKFHPSKKKPFKVFANDFDKTGTCDVVLSKEYKGRLVPTRGKECSSDQMPFIDRKFPTYTEYANASLEDILGEDEVENALKLEANTFESVMLLNNGNGGFSSTKLPELAQVAPILSSTVKDVNNDGNQDVIIVGNMFGAEVETPRYDAGDGMVLFGRGDGSFEPCAAKKSGFYTPHNAKSIASLNIGATGETLYFVGNNNYKLQIFSLKKDNRLSAN